MTDYEILKTLRFNGNGNSNTIFSFKIEELWKSKTKLEPLGLTEISYFIYT